MNKKMSLSLTCAFSREARIQALTLLGVGGIAIASLLSGGCAAPASMSSSVQYAGPNNKGKLVQALHVAKAQEGRPDNGKSRIGIGFITFIPLVPYGAQRFTPERYFANSAMITYDFRDDLSQTIIKDLSSAGLAQSVSPDVQTGFNGTVTGVHRMEITLKEGIWHRNFTTYGCSFMGIYFWLVGLPVSYGDAELTFEAAVFAPDGKELGRREFNAKLPLTESAYVPHMFPRRLPLLYEKVSPELRGFVGDCLNRSAMKDAIPAFTAQNQVRAPVADSSATPQGGGSVAERLMELKTLKDTRVITEEEYQAARKRIVEAL